jgi:hypothetical protein
MSFFGGWSMPWDQQQAPIATNPLGAQSTTAVPPSPVTESQSKMGFFPSMMGGFGQNSGMLLGMASGLLTSPAQGGGWGAALQGGMQGQTLDMKRRLLAKAEAEKAAKNAALQELLSGQNLPPGQAQLLSQVPDLAQDILQNRMTPKAPEYREVNGRLVKIDSSGVNEIYAAPQAPKETWVDEPGEYGAVRQRGSISNELRTVQPPRAQKEYFDPYETQQMKDKAESEQSWRTTAEGSEAYLRKLARLREKISGRDDLFGPLQASGPNRFFANIKGTDAEKARQRVEADLADMELDVAKLKLKGQGAVSEAERSIAKATLPKLANADSATALQILDQLEVEARENLAIAAQKGVYRPSGVGGAAQAPPQQAAITQRPGQEPMVKTDEQYLALPSGTRFMDPKGNIRVKP